MVITLCFPCGAIKNIMNLKCKHCHLISSVSKKTYKYRKGECAKCKNKSLYQKVGTIINDGVKVISYGKTLKGQTRNLFSLECITCGHKWRVRSSLINNASCSPCGYDKESYDF